MDKAGEKKKASFGGDRSFLGRGWKRDSQVDSGRGGLRMRWVAEG